MPGTWVAFLVKLGSRRELWYPMWDDIWATKLLVQPAGCGRGDTGRGNGSPSVIRHRSFASQIKKILACKMFGSEV